MILTELELQNFGVYRGSHVIDLEPADRDSPIVLFGGLNGVGKTTVLEAVLLALYGKRTPIAKREGLRYDDYLRRCIHGSVASHDGATVRLRFRVRSEGEDQTVRISRTWHETKSGVKEVEEVHLGESGEEVLERHLTGRWAEYIDEIIPLGVASLFFFDADRIEGFADLANSGELIRTGIHSLLGLDLIDQLLLDLQVLERRKLAAEGKTDDRSVLTEAEEKMASASADRAFAEQKLHQLQEELEIAQAKLGEIEARFDKEGGALFTDRTRLETQREQILESAGDATESLREIAAGTTPLLLVSDLLSEIKEEDKKDQEREASVLLTELLQERDQRINEFLIENDGVEIAPILNDFLATDREERQSADDEEPVFGLSRDSRLALSHLLSSGLEDTQQTARSAVQQLQALDELRDEIDRKLMGVPEEDAIADLLKTRGETQSAVAEAQRNVERAEPELERCLRAVEAAERSLSTIQKKMASELTQEEESARTIRFSEESRTRLEEFRLRVLDRNIGRIEQLVLESFRQLSRKEGLVQELEIDRTTLGLRLYGRDARSVHPDRLSAGERQLLAVSLLWGLARASQRILPMIVDTPLGRLDSIHREHLIDRYFPYASHQVVLLSTDEEIGDAHLDRLGDAVGRSYRLEFDDATGCTSVTEGYFAEEALV